MKKAVSVMLCLCAVMTFLLSTAAASSFPDVPDDAPYAEAAEYLNDAGIMQGDTKGNFNPHQTITRAQMAAIVCRILEETNTVEANSIIFSDVSKSHWANNYIMLASQLGIVNGYSDKTFKPENNVTYEQSVAMVVRAIGRTGRIQIPENYPDGFLQTALDNHWLDGISSEKGEFLSRADIAMLIYNYYINTATIM